MFAVMLLATPRTRPVTLFFARSWQLRPQAPQRTFPQQVPMGYDDHRLPSTPGLRQNPMTAFAATRPGIASPVVATSPLTAPAAADIPRSTRLNPCRGIDLEGRW